MCSNAFFIWFLQLKTHKTSVPIHLCIMLLYVVKITGTPDNDMQPHNINSLCEAYDVPFLFKLWDFKMFPLFCPLAQKVCEVNNRCTWSKQTHCWVWFSTTFWQICVFTSCGNRGKWLAWPALFRLKVIIYGQIWEGF